MQIRKLENEVTFENKKLVSLVQREIKSTAEKSAHDLGLVEKDIKDSVRAFQRQRARDRADQDIAFKGAFDDIKVHG